MPMGKFADNIGLTWTPNSRRRRVIRSAVFHLERAHILGQASTREHVRVHWRMLTWALRHRDAREFFGQLLRLTGAATKTFIGMVPTGNTGGSNVSAIQPMPVDPELAAIIERHAATRASYQRFRSSRSFTNTVRASGFSPISGTSRATWRRSPDSAAAGRHSRAFPRPWW